MKKIPNSLLVVALLAGMGAGVAGITSAATTTPADSGTVSSGGTATNPHGFKGHHAPPGGDGVISAINGSTITMTEEADEGGTVYNVDASTASIMKDGAAGKLSDLSVGEKIFVKGTVSGTNVAATNIFTGHPGSRMGFFHKGNKTGWHKGAKTNQSASTGNGGNPSN